VWATSWSETSGPTICPNPYAGCQGRDQVEVYGARYAFGGRHDDRDGADERASHENGAAKKSQGGMVDDRQDDACRLRSEICRQCGAGAPSMME
jgi:hypothetical protein